METDRVMCLTSAPAGSYYNNRTADTEPERRAKRMCLSPSYSFQRHGLDFGKNYEKLICDPLFYSNSRISQVLTYTKFNISNM